jgi:ADP-heptose:LPS heptosyltransferase
MDRLIEDLRVKVFIFAGSGEKNDVRKMIDGLRNKGEVYEFSDASLEETVALVERCQIFISNDTGILRFADALNKKIVALYGPIDEKVYGPYPPGRDGAIVLKKDMACRPCYKRFRLTPCVHDRRCLKDIRVEEVLTAAKDLLKI